jgi:hypothetical protein
MLSRYRLFLPVVAACLLVLSGCSDRRPVEGTVTLDGQPVDGGKITFVPKSGKDPVSADIVGGKFALPSGRGPVVGSYTVQIFWKKKTGRKVDTPGDPGVPMEEAVDVIPSQYNAQSTLTAEVKSSGNAFTFDCKSK